MEFEKGGMSDLVLVKRSQLSIIPEYQKITFELPYDIGDNFLKLCDKTNRDPDEVVARLIKQWTKKERKIAFKTDETDIECQYSASYTWREKT